MNKKTKMKESKEKTIRFTVPKEHYFLEQIIVNGKKTVSRIVKKKFKSNTYDEQVKELRDTNI